MKTSDEPKTMRNNIFVLNNWTQEQWNSIKNLPYNYLIMGREICPTTGTPHIQGYIEWRRGQTFDYIRCKLFNSHIEKRKGTAHEAADYCKKTFNWEEWGTISCQGHRSDIEEAVRIADIYKDPRDVAEHCPHEYVKYHRGLERYINVRWHRPQMRPNMKNIYIHGPTGSGKTKYVFDRHHPEEIYIKDPSHKWWDGYTGHPVILIDDIRHSIESFDYMLRLLDRYPFQGEVKGGTVGLNPEVIYLTSDRSPEAIWSKEGDDNNVAQILRRISTVIHLKKETHVEDSGTEVSGNTKTETS